MGRIKKHKKYNVCRHCDKLYEVGFWGTGFVYCSKHCGEIANRAIQEERRKKLQYERNSKKECVLCHRNILGVGKRKAISKFCSRRCMFIHARMRDRKDKFVNIKVPIKDMLDGNVKITLNGKVNIGGKLIGVYDGN